jgi:magnesium-protoporphyrin IX monomethyl ester (oxidative) cyclase
MWVRDHARKDFHNALGVDIDWYDQEVFRKTSTIAKQVFPMEIDIDHPAWIPNLNRMNAAMIDMEKGKKKGGLSGRLSHATASARAMLAFARLYMIPVKGSTPPVSVRLEPSY